MLNNDHRITEKAGKGKVRLGDIWPREGTFYYHWLRDIAERGTAIFVSGSKFKKRSRPAVVTTIAN